MKSITIRECLAVYLDARTPLIVADARAERASLLITQEIGHCFVGRSTFADTVRYAKRRMAQGISSSTIKRELTVLKAALHYSVHTGLIEYVPQVHVAKESKPRMRVLSPEEVGSLLRVAKTERPWMYAFVVMLLLTAQRREAVLSLEWSQVDLTQRVIHFTKSDISLPERRKGRAAVPINDELLKLLNGIKRNGPYVIASANGKRLRSVDRQWHKMCAKVGLGAEVTPHVIRHTVATTLIRNGEDIYRVSKLLAHASVKTTEVSYVKFDHEPLRSVVDKLGIGVTT